MKCKRILKSLKRDWLPGLSKWLSSWDFGVYVWCSHREHLVQRGFELLMFASIWFLPKFLDHIFNPDFSCLLNNSLTFRSIKIRNARCNFRICRDLWMKASLKERLNWSVSKRSTRKLWVSWWTKSTNCTETNKSNFLTRRRLFKNVIYYYFVALISADRSYFVQVA